jgi:branched-chain amino acid transport system substrate-binding protein
MITFITQRRQMAVLALTTLSSLCFSSVFAQTREVKIGFVLPLSGGTATIGNQTKVGAEIAIEQINAAGGIKSLGGAKLVPVFGDSQSKPDVGVTETERLITREQVAVVVGAYNSAVTFPATEVAERYKTPWLVTGSVKDEITERGFKYVFRPNNKAVYDAREQMDAIDLLAKESGNKPQTIGLFYEGTDWGRSHTANIKKFATERGYRVVLDESYPPNQSDFSAQILKVRALKPEALIVVAYTPDHILFNRQFSENKVNVPYGIHSVGGGSEDPSFYKALPQRAVDYMFVQDDFQVDIMQATKDPNALDANKRFQDRMGYPLNAYGAQGVSNVYILRDVLERSASADREKIRDSLAATNITSGTALITGYSRINFDDKGQNVHAHGAITQNQGGQRRTVWPAANRVAGTKPIWPLPDWSAR